MFSVMPEIPNELTIQLARLSRELPITGDLLTALSGGGEGPRPVSIEEVVNAFIDAVARLERKSLQPAAPPADIGDIEVPITMFGKTYRVTPNSAARRRRSLGHDDASGGSN